MERLAETGYIGEEPMELINNKLPHVHDKYYIKGPRTITEADISTIYGDRVLIRPHISMMGDILHDPTYSIVVDTMDGVIDISINRVRKGEGK